MTALFAGRYAGNTIQVADPPQTTTLIPSQATPPLHDILVGSMLQAAGVKALNAYSGLGFVSFAHATCQNPFGRTCPQLYRLLWQRDRVTATALADLLRLQTVVVQNHYLPGHASVRTPPPGWRITQNAGDVTVIRRIASLPWAGGRLSSCQRSVRVRADVAGQESEQISYSGSGQITLAMLAWPGWYATAAGRQIPVRMDNAGLIVLDLPPASPAVATLTLRFVPPGYRLGVPLFYTGIALGLGYGVTWVISRRRRAHDRPDPAATTRP